MKFGLHPMLSLMLPMRTRRTRVICEVTFWRRIALRLACLALLAGCGSPTRGGIAGVGALEPLPLGLRQDDSTASSSMPGLRFAVRVKDGMRMAEIPRGAFKMGRVSAHSGDETLGRGDEPRHIVHISKSFFIDTTEVTNSMFDEFVKDSKYRSTSESLGNPTGSQGTWEEGRAGVDPESWARLPVVWVSWDDASAYAKWCGASLPTEAQWECVARGGREGDVLPWAPGERSLYFRPSSLPIAPVRSVRPNAYGVYDILGNAAEWCADALCHYSAGEAIDPLESCDTETKVVRDVGVPKDGAGYAEISERLGVSPDGRGKKVGFRCAVSR